MYTVYDRSLSYKLMLSTVVACLQLESTHIVQSTLRQDLANTQKRNTTFFVFARWQHCLP